MVPAATTSCGSDSSSMADRADRFLIAVLALAATGCGVGSGVSVVTTIPVADSSTTAGGQPGVPPGDTSEPPSTDSAVTTSVVTSTDPVTTASPVPQPTAASTAAPTAPPTPAPTTPATDPRPLAIDLLAMVRVEREHRGGYERKLFGYPTSFGGGCDTRDEVLQRDSLSPVQMDPVGCTVVAGDWYSPYDDLMFETPQDIEIDHVVALKEAWDSGAWQWGQAVLEAFANDVTDPRTLRAVSGDSNGEKSDKDPSNWLPRNAADVCRFVGDWTAIKVRWGLSMDESEYGRIRNLLRGPCADWRVDPIAPTPVPLP